MGYPYHWDTLIFDGRIVPLRFIESIQLPPKDSEDSTVNKLKGDYTIRIITRSGKEYEVSMKEISDHRFGGDLQLNMVADGVLDRWIYIHKVN